MTGGQRQARTSKPAGGAASRHGTVPSWPGSRWLLTRRGSASWASGSTSPASLPPSSHGPSSSRRVNRHVITCGNASPPAMTSTTRAPRWRRLLGRWGRADGPAGSILVGKVSAPFDGVKVAVPAIDSGPEFFSIGVEVVPGLRTGLPYRALDDLCHITWRAVDDQGNYSLAEQGSWSPGASRAQGSLGFWPGLDPRAAWVDLMPTTTTARAVIRVPIPWAAASPPLRSARPPRRRPYSEEIPSAASLDPTDSPPPATSSRNAESVSIAAMASATRSSFIPRPVSR
jgi:hypothetical protein